MSLLLLFQNYPHTTTGSIPLFIQGSFSGWPEDSVNLFISGNEALSSNKDLFIGGYDKSNASTNLYISGSTGSSKSLNLFIKTNDIPVITGNIPLFVTGSTIGVDKLFDTLDLFILGDRLHANMNLFISGYDSGITSKNLNLFIEGQPHYGIGSLDLFLGNYVNGLSKSITLFVKGDGVTAGTIPASAALNLFLQRMPSAVLDLFLQGPYIPAYNSIPLYVNGSEIETGSITLAIPYTFGKPFKTITLYTHGF